MSAESQSDQLHAAQDEARQAVRGLLRAQRRLRGRDAGRRAALSFSQYLLLHHLRDEDVHAVGRLATAAEISPALTTAMVDVLIERGWVERVPCEDDRRKRQVRITEAGREQYDTTHARFNAAYATAWDGMSENELQQLTRALGRITELFDSF